MNSLVPAFQTPLQRRSRRRRYTLPVVAIIPVTVALYALQNNHYLSDHVAPFILYFFVVIMSAWYGGFIPGIIASILSVFSAEVSFFGPMQRSVFHNVEEFFLLTLFFVVSITTSWLLKTLHDALAKQAKVERELRLSENRIFQILESVTGCFFTLDRMWRFVHINSRCNGYLPYPFEELRGRKLWEIFPEWENTEIYRQLHRAQVEKTSLEFEFYDEARSKWYAVNASPFGKELSIHYHDITQRKKGEIELEESEKKLRRSQEELDDFFENGSVGLHLMSDEGIILRANKAELDMLGYSSDEYIGHSIVEFHCDPDTVYDMLNRLRHGETLSNYPARLRCKDGSIKQVLISSNVLWEGSRFMHTRSFTRDVTAEFSARNGQNIQYQLNQILAEPASVTETIQKILEAIARALDCQIGAFWKVEEDASSIRFAQIWAEDSFQNSRFVQETKRGRLSMGIGLPGRIWEKNQPCWIKELAEDANFSRFACAQENDVHSGLGFAIQVGEETLGVMEFFSSKNLEFDDGLMEIFKLMGAQLGHYLERKEAEEALYETQNQLKAVMEAGRMGYWAWDICKNKATWSENLEPLCGFPKGSFFGNYEHFFSSIHPDDAEAVSKAILNLRDIQPDYHTEFRIIWPDGSVHWLAVRAQTFYHDETPIKMVGLAIDITELKTATEALRIANEEMEIRVMERTAQLARTNLALEEEILERKRVEKEVLEISEKEQRRFGEELHDGLCQHLAGINMLTKVLSKKMEERNIPEAFELQKISEMINDSVNKARDMARGLYPVELEDNSLMLMLRELTEKMEKLLHIRCAFVCPKPIFIDDLDLATHIYRIAHEAIHNAVKHGQAHRIEIEFFERNGLTTLAIKDDGMGMDSKSNLRGIGLHIMRYRARMIGGALEFLPNSPQGTILCCSFQREAQERRRISYHS